MMLEVAGGILIAAAVLASVWGIAVFWRRHVLDTGAVVMLAAILAVPLCLVLFGGWIGQMIVAFLFIPPLIGKGVELLCRGLFNAKN